MRRLKQHWLDLPQEARRLLATAAGLTMFGLVFGGVSLRNAVSSTDNQRKFSHGRHVEAVVESVGLTRRVYMSIVLTYTVDGREFQSGVADPSAVTLPLTPGQNVDAVYLPEAPQRVALAGQYDSGFQNGSVLSASMGALMVLFGLALFGRGLRALKGPPSLTDEDWDKLSLRGSGKLRMTVLDDLSAASGGQESPHSESRADR